ncbi:MAG: ABC transporter substrate-binding protein [Desulfococcaceae bacterium]
MKKRHLAWGLAAAGLFLALTDMPEMLHAEEPLKIGIIYYFNDRTGEGIRRGAEMAAEEINSMGGILGKPVQLVFSDDKFKPEFGAYEYTKLVHEDKVAAVIGTTSSEITLAVMEQMAQYKVPFLSTSSASPKVTEKVEQTYAKYRYFFRIHNSSDEIAEILDLFQK